MIEEDAIAGVGGANHKKMLLFRKGEKGEQNEKCSCVRRGAEIAILSLF